MKLSISLGLIKLSGLLTPAGVVLSTGIPTGPITTYETGTFTVSGTTITDEASRQTNIVAVDVQATNGVIHVIDNVILPNLN